MNVATFRKLFLNYNIDRDGRMRKLRPLVLKSSDRKDECVGPRPSAGAFMGMCWVWNCCVINVNVALMLRWQSFYCMTSKCGWESMVT